MSAHPTSPGPRSFGLRLHVLMLLVGLLASTDLLQAAMVGYTAGPVMGELGVSPEEYSGVATLYAVIAITMIALHRWLVERLGWRLFMVANAAAFAAGGLVCACAEGMPAFVAGRAIMALGGAGFFTASRVLINRILPGMERFAGIKRLAIGIAAGATLGPILAAFAVAHGSWRWIYVVLVAIAVVVALVSGACFRAEVPTQATRTRSRPTAVIRILVASFLLLHALQRSVFDWYGNRGEVLACLAAGLALLAWFAYRETRHPTPLLHIGRIAQPRYLLALGMFALCYLFISTTNFVMPVMLTAGLGLPLQTIGFYLGVGSGGGFLAWLALGRLLPRVPSPQPFYLAAFGLLLAFALAMARLSEDAAPVADVVPALVLFGAFVITGLATTALQAFRDLQADETVFSNGNQVKNMVSQFCSAAGVAVATLAMQARASVRWSLLVETVNPANLAVDGTLAGFANALTTATGDAEGRQRAVAQLGQVVAREATFLAALDFFQLLAAAAALVLAGVAGWWGVAAWREARRVAREAQPVACEPVCEEGAWGEV